VAGLAALLVVLAHPAITPGVRDRAKRLRDALITQASPAQVEAATTQAATATLEALATGLVPLSAA